MVAAGSLALANCASSGKFGAGLDPKYGVAASPRVVEDGEPVPKGGGVYRIGKPYTVAGRMYVPEENLRYRAEGLASWYGDDFHGRLTANGEVFDMDAITAAHPTLPIPSYARVTNLANRRSIIVRINDRGPYKRNRILDLSYAAARQIDLVRSGSARVKVEFLDDALPPTTPGAMPLRVTQEEWHALPVSQMLEAQPLVVQAGAYRSQDNAVRVHKTLTVLFPNVWIAMASEISQPLHRVRLGPFQDRAAAERVVHDVAARGYAAVIVSIGR